MGGCFFTLAMVCFIIGVVQLLSPVPASRGSSSSGFLPRNVPRPAGLTPRISQRGVSSMPVVPAGESISTGGEPMVTNVQKLDWVKVGGRIYVGHPVKGELMAHILGRIVYAELWQAQRGPQVPWTPTGNAFVGFWLEGGLFLLNWQTRFYLLDEAVQLSDADIQRDFLPHARKFAQSDQTADVYFSYPPAMWHIDDIGKFRVDVVEGEGLNFCPGAIGRFIHASGDAGRGLVVEDYEGGGGGQDTVWIGYQVAEDGIKPA